VEPDKDEPELTAQVWLWTDASGLAGVAPPPLFELGWITAPNRRPKINPIATPTTRNRTFDAFEEEPGNDTDTTPRKVSISSILKGLGHRPYA
jgi:hypothetical protein